MDVIAYKRIRAKLDNEGILRQVLQGPKTQLLIKTMPKVYREKVRYPIEYYSYDIVKWIGAPIKKIITKDTIYIIIPKYIYEMLMSNIFYSYWLVDFQEMASLGFTSMEHDIKRIVAKSKLTALIKYLDDRTNIVNYQIMID